MKKNYKRIFAIALVGFFLISNVAGTLYADDDTKDISEDARYGGGYAATGQVDEAGYACELYNAENGLPTSDANTIISTHDGYMWIGGYSGVIRYDGNDFERLDPTNGLANAKSLYEDSKQRLWVGTNDNGVVLLDDNETIRFTYKEGLPSSTIRSFAESSDGIMYVGTTNGVCYFDEDLHLHEMDDDDLKNEYIIRMSVNDEGIVYGSTKSGNVFCIEDKKVKGFYSSDEIGKGIITTIFADPENKDYVYFGTEGDKVYYGDFSKGLSEIKEIDVAPATNISWIDYASDRIWVLSVDVIGYLDEDENYHTLSNIPLNSSIEDMTEDYQGNIWFTSSRQGVMKLVTSNFENITDEAGLEEGVVNSTCIHDGLLYIGTDKGLQITDSDNKSVDNELKDYMGATRIRCIVEDNDKNLWLSAYDNGMGLTCYTNDGQIKSYTTEEGLIDNGTRCTYIASDGAVVEGTNGGISVIKDGTVIKNIGEADGIKNTVILTVCEGDDGSILAGSDGDGIYEISDEKVKKIGRDDGLTSDVVMRIKKDEKRDVFWIITSNSIEYMKDGVITCVEEFPYTNNFDLYFDDNDNAWVLSSYGIYCVSAAEMIENGDIDYRLYNNSDGLPSVPTGNAFSELDEKGNLYISGREGVSKVNIDNFFEQSGQIRVGIKSVLIDNEEISANSDGSYTIPKSRGRIQINPSILNYKLFNPTIHMYLEGANDEGITDVMTNLASLEYTDLQYGDYVLHIQIVDTVKGDVYQDETFDITKQPRLFELLWMRGLLIVLGMILAGFMVYRIMTGTIIRRQYEEIRAAKEEAERANGAKSRFLANMSHEIRTPINTIMGMDEMIMREDAKDVPKAYFMSVTNYAMDIKNASESLLGLINDVLDISKIESGKMHLVEQAYDVADMLRSIVSMIRVRSEQKKLTFDVDIDEGIPVKLFGDNGKIKQIVLNLLTNAVKYTEKGGFALKVSIDSKDEKTVNLRFSVKDTGIGVKPEDMDKLFSAFERLDEEKNSGIQGTGLGLDISKQFSELMGGKLWCESEYGKGSEFIFTVSQRIEDESEIGEFKEHDEALIKGPYVPQFRAPEARVLVVDDNPMNLTVIQGLLKATAIQITTAASGEECLEILKNETFNVILLDHMMPGMDGLETVAEIRKLLPDIPVYALTANAATSGDEFYKAHGFDGYLAKPVDGLTIEKAIMKYLPDELISKPDDTADDTDIMTLPSDMAWLYDVDGISVDEGIKNSGGAEPFVFSLKLFFDTIDDNSKVIRDAYENGDIRLYTIKVHALKSSARIIGATELSRLAEALENAGNDEDTDFIIENADRLLSLYAAYKDRLKGLSEEKGFYDSDKDTREMISEEELSEGIEALKEVAVQMDYDAVCMVLDELSVYRLPEEADEKISELKKLLKVFDWDRIEELVSTL